MHSKKIQPQRLEWEEKLSLSLKLAWSLGFVRVVSSISLVGLVYLYEWRFSWAFEPWRQTSYKQLQKIYKKYLHCHRIIFELKYYLPYLWLFQSNIMNVIGNNFFSNTINVVKIGKIHLFQNICSEFNESFNISDVLIRPRQAEENLFIDYENFSVFMIYTLI